MVESVPSSTLGSSIRFFISSTFLDFQVERDVLQQLVFPKLRALCAQSGFRLQPIDLRWGVTEEASTDRQTLRICFDELERCRQFSPDFFLLVQLGNRYGSYILPPTLTASAATRQFTCMSEEERQTFDAVYRLDENALPPEYVLLRREGSDLLADERLRQILAQAGRLAKFTEEELLPFEGSATHREIQRGLRGTRPGGASDCGVLCAIRRFTGQPQGDEVQRFLESDAVRATKIQQLTAAVVDRLPNEHVLRYTIDWHGEQGPAFDETAVAKHYLDFLTPHIERVIAARTAARVTAAAQGRDATTLANAVFEEKLTIPVMGRDAELAHVEGYLSGKYGAGLPLIVTGAAGSGKSALLVEACRDIRRRLPSAALITRYIGITPGASTLVEALNSVRAEVARSYGHPESSSILDDETLVSTLASELATIEVPPQRPLLLVIDALDQLDAAAVRIDWLPLRLAPGVRVVISVLTERRELTTLRARLPDEQVLTLGPLDMTAGRILLKCLLELSPPRALTSQQEAAALAAFSIQGLPLYLRLVASVARGWRSFDFPHIAATPLPTTTDDLIEATIARLEAPGRDGRELVERALGNLAASQFGLAEDELLELLARDADVREALHRLSPSSPPIDEHLPLPVALWAGLHAEIEPLLSEREMDGVELITFYHRQLRTVVQARYRAGAKTPPEVERHQELAAYFATQPWQFGQLVWNWRKLRELVTQQEQAGHWDSAERTLADLASELEQTVAGNSLLSSGETVDASDIEPLLVLLRDRLSTGSHWRLGQRFYQVLLAIAQKEGDRSTEGSCLNNLGILANYQGQGATEYHEQALAIARDLGDRELEELALNSLGALADRQSRWQEGRRYYEQALAIIRKLGDRTDEQYCLNNLGHLADMQGKRKEARQYYEQALAIARDLGNRAMEGTTLNNLGLLADKQRRWQEARHCFEQSLAIARAVCNRAGEGTTLNNLGILANNLHQWKEAAVYFEQALAITREVNNRQVEGTILHNLGILAFNLRQWSEAGLYFEQAIAIRRDVGDWAGEASTRGHLGVLVMRRAWSRWWPFDR